ncbi:MAG: cell division protein ZapA [Synergistaceae bacterium]|jgi:hypothetical protein|nr:cell division protein ZapA [Synergistaceae bacterium]
MESRSVPLLVGNKSYSLLTSLDDEKLKAVYGVLQDYVAHAPQTLEQDQRLFLACIMLADKLVNTTARLEDILLSFSDGKDPAEENKPAEGNGSKEVKTR